MPAIIPTGTRVVHLHCSNVYKYRKVTPHVSVSLHRADRTIRLILQEILDFICKMCKQDVMFFSTLTELEMSQ